MRVTVASRRQFLFGSSLGVGRFGNPQPGLPRYGPDGSGRFAKSRAVLPRSLFHGLFPFRRPILSAHTAAVSEYLPAVTIIIPARPDEKEVRAIPAVRLLDYPRDRLEVLLVRGKHPSAQRNAAMHKARGEIIYFLDDDSRPQPDAIRRAVEHFRRHEVVIVGGPNLCLEDAPFKEHAFALTMATWLAFGPSRVRYWPVGEVRETDEKELILCNMLARKKQVLDEGGFSVKLYPNEENLLMDQLKSRRLQLIYDPDIVVVRRPRSTLRAFAKMLWSYGRGRAQQVKLNPTLGSAANFVPPIFVLYLALLSFIPILFPATRPWFLWPMALYVGSLLAQALFLKITDRFNLLKKHNSFGLIALVVPLILLTHISYGLGFLKGICSKVKARESLSIEGIEIETIKL